MQKMFIHFIKNVENYKVYHIIIIFTLAFVFMLFNGFYHIQNELKSFASQNRVLIAKDIDYTISSWISERINNLESSVKYLSQDARFQDETTLKAFAATFLEDNRYFDAIQILIPNHYFYVNTMKFNDYRENPIYIDEKTGIEPLKTPWFLDTMHQQKTTIYGMSVHGYLLEKTLNICTPIVYKEHFEGVFCGILKAKSLFEKIEKLTFPQNASYFISNDEGNILTPFNNDIFQKELEKFFLNKIDLQTNEPQKIIIDNAVITLSKFQRFNWYIGVLTDKEDILHESRQRVTSHALWLLLCFIFLLIVVNSAHEFLRRRVERKQKEYEFMLAHRSRISEIGKLMSSINHQLKQPLNATALVVSTTLDMSERELLDRQTLECNLKLCQKSITLMDKTIGIFRNFYRSNEEVNAFNLLECIQSVLHVNHTDLSRHNIIVEMNTQEIEHIEVVSIENYIQQILLVLIQNAKDALIAELKNTLKKEMTQKIYLKVTA